MVLHFSYKDTRHHLIKLKEKTKAKEQPLDEVRERVKRMALQEKKEKAKQNFMESLRKKAEIDKHLELLRSPEQANVRNQRRSSLRPLH